MKRKTMTLAMLAVLTVGVLVTASCRMAAYTAPLVPRFTPSAAAVTSTFYTNASAQLVVLSGSVDLTDTLGDAGFQANVSSLTIYALQTNLGSTEQSASYNADLSVTGAYKTVKKADAKASTKYTLSFTTPAQSGLYAFLVSYTNSANWSYVKGKIFLTVKTDDGNNGYTLDDYSKLTATITSAIGNKP